MSKTLEIPPQCCEKKTQKYRNKTVFPVSRLTNGFYNYSLKKYFFAQRHRERRVVNSIFALRSLCLCVKFFMQKKEPPAGRLSDNNHNFKIINQRFLIFLEFLLQLPAIFHRASI